MMLAFGATWAALEELGAHMLRKYSPFEVVWVRYGVHLLFMLVLWGFRDPRSLIATQRPIFQFVRSGMMLIMPASWIIGMYQGVNPSTVMTVFWLSPVFVVCFAVVFLRERPSLQTWVASALASAGAIALMHPSLPHSLRALVWPLLMAGSFSLYVVMTRSLRTDSTRSNLFYTALGVFLCLTPAMPFVWVTPNFHDALVLVGIGLLGFAGLYALDRAAHTDEVSRKAPVLGLQTVFALLGGVMLGRYLPTNLMLLGVVVVCAGAMLAWANDNKWFQRQEVL
jgi:drug/metabolite transporter (DMT)-like permease